MTEKPDNGAMVTQEAVPIGPDDTAQDVFDKVTGAAERALERVLPALIAGTATHQPQDLTKGAYFGPRTIARESKLSLFPHSKRRRTPSSSGRIQPVRLFNDGQAVYHAHQSVYQDQSVYHESVQEEYHPDEAVNEMYMVGGEEGYHNEQHLADDNFGHFSHQEEQSQYEGESPQDEPPYDY